MSSLRSGPQSRWGVGGHPRPGRIEYRLMRESIVKEYRRGRLGRLEVCDAQPELLRVAKNLGRETDTECPICEHEQLVHVMFAFGPGLPPGGLPLTDLGVLSKTARKSADVACYLVEVCTGCSWNHLLSVFAPGGHDR
ncbi:MAG: DUF5318 family protein [Acidimicrobiales bacterium]